MSPEQRLSDLLDRCARRLAWRQRLPRSAWLALAALVVAELGLAAGDPLRLPLLALAGLVLLAAGGALAWGPRPSRLVAAAVLDARLGAGASLAAATEALAGSHPRFAPHLLREGARRLDGASLPRLFPLRAPAGLILGLAAALLFPFLLSPESSRADASEAASTREPPSLLAPAALAGGAPAPPEGAAPPLEPAEAYQPLVAASSATPAPADPLAVLPLDQADALRERLAAVLAELPAGGSAGPSSAQPGSGAPDADPLAQALRAGDAAQALQELEALAEAARAGQRAAAARLRELAAGLHGAGAGRGGEASPGAVSPSAPDAGGPALRRARASLPWSLRETTRRYFLAGPGGSP